MSETIESWSGQYRCTPLRSHRPRSAGEVAALLASAAQRGTRVRAVGAAHSPSDIAMCDGEVIRLDHMAGILAVDRAAGRVRVQAGATLEQLNRALAVEGLALPNLGSISAQTVAGATATATHGTGLAFGVLSTLIEELELATPDGRLRRLSRESSPDLFQAARVGLGALGVITELELRVVPAFDLEVAEFRSSLAEVLDRLEERLELDHYRFWLLPHVDAVWEWWATRRPRGTSPGRLARWRAAAAAVRDRAVGYHMFEALLYLGSFAPALIPPANRWYASAMLSAPRRARGRSDLLFNFDCLFRQLVNEWAIPIEHTAAAVRALDAMIAQHGFSVHLPIEVRFVAGDDIWMSPCHGRDSCYIGIIAYMPYGRQPDVRSYFSAYEEIMLGFGGRPHWAKRFGPEAETLRSLYPRWGDFQRVRATLDPSGVLSNPYCDRVLGTVEAEDERRRTGPGYGRIRDRAGVQRQRDQL